MISDNVEDSIVVSVAEWQDQNWAATPRKDRIRQIFEWPEDAVIAAYGVSPGWLRLMRNSSTSIDEILFQAEFRDEENEKTHWGRHTNAQRSIKERTAKAGMLGYEYSYKDEFRYPTVYRPSRDIFYGMHVSNQLMSLTGVEPFKKGLVQARFCEDGGGDEITLLAAPALLYARLLGRPDALEDAAFDAFLPLIGQVFNVVLAEGRIVDAGPADSKVVLDPEWKKQGCYDSTRNWDALLEIRKRRRSKMPTETNAEGENIGG